MAKIINSIREGVKTMAMIYVALIIKGKRTFASVPKALQAQVREILVDLELEELTKED